jgi:hypothetical protein
LHLNDHAAFRKLLPSKIFEYAATAKPMMASVAGFAAEFLESDVEGVEIFPPCYIPEMIQSPDRHLAGPGQIERLTLKKKYSQKFVMQEMTKDILAMGGDS